MMPKKLIDAIIQEIQDGNAWIIVTHYIPNNAFPYPKYVDEEAKRLKRLGCKVHIQHLLKLSKKYKFFPNARRVLRKLAEDEIKKWEEIKDKEPKKLTQEDRRWLNFFDYIPTKLVRLNNKNTLNQAKLSKNANFEKNIY